MKKTMNEVFDNILSWKAHIMFMGSEEAASEILQNFYVDSVKESGGSAKLEDMHRSVSKKTGISYEGLQKGGHSYVMKCVKNKMLVQTTRGFFCIK